MICERMGKDGIEEREYAAEIARAFLVETLKLCHEAREVMHNMCIPGCDHNNEFCTATYGAWSNASCRFNSQVLELEEMLHDN